MNYDPKKFSWLELITSNNGKTSGTQLVGVVASMVCLMLFIVLVIFYFINTGEASTVLLLIDKTTVYFGISASLMGVKSISSCFGGNRVIVTNTDNNIQENQVQENQVQQNLTQEGEMQ